MNSLEFLKIELQKIADNFPNVNIKYGYNTKIESHIIELLPVSEYYNNLKLEDAWIPLSMEFLQKYTDEGIAFISSDSSLSLKTTIFEYNTNACTEEKVIAEIFAPIVDNVFYYNFPTEIPNGELMKMSDIGNMVSEGWCDIHNEFYFDNSYLAAA